MVVIIKGIKFKVKLLTKKAYCTKYSKDHLAHVNSETRSIIFRDDHIKKNIVVHELVHAFIAALHLGSCNDLSLEDFEEIICEMMEDHLLEINSMANKIMKHLKEEE